jgi:site-specific DNA-methyltransferase (adenine-specific)
MNEWTSDCGTVRLICGDCLDVLPTLDTVDLVLTDPPYGVTYQSNHRVGAGSQPITNDGTRLSLRLYRRIVPLLKATHILWFTRWDAWPDVWEILGQSIQVRGLLVWDKGTPGMGDLSHWGCSHELIASCGSGALRGKRDNSVLRFPTCSPHRRNHPTEKPIDLLVYLITKMTTAGDTVMDCFAGSGTTGVACINTGRKFIGVEIDPGYFDIAVRRCKEALAARDSLLIPA